MEGKVVEGTVADGYEPVKAAFDTLIQKGVIGRGQLCVYVKGKVVIDLCGKSRQDEDYNHNSIQILFR